MLQANNGSSHSFDKGKPSTVLAVLNKKDSLDVENQKLEGIQQD
jgi:hypothetical protein